MSIFKVDPFNGIDTIARRMNTIAREFDNGVEFETRGFSPRVDIRETEEQFRLFLELPGVDKENISMLVTDDNTLEIKGEKPSPEGEAKIVRSERGFGEFKREFILPENVDAESINAEFKNGVLSVEINKVQPVKKEIKIEVK
jgi:HSP20 family protein